MLAAFEGACIGAFVDDAGLLGNKDNVESARARVGVVAVWPHGVRGPWRPLSI